MKTIIFLTAAVVTALSSCTKCTVCTQPQSTDVRVCEKDYNSQADYGAAIDFYEAAGYNCYKSW